MSRPEWYTAPDLVGFSDDLKPMHESGLAYHDHKARGSADTNSRKQLRAVHALILEGGAAFRAGFCVSPVTRRNGTAAFEAVKVAAAGRDILSQSEFDGAAATASAVRSHPWIADRLDAWRSDGWRMRVEQPLRWHERVELTDPPAVWPPLGTPAGGPVPDPPDIETAVIDGKGIADAVALNRRTGEGIVIDCKGVPTLVDRPLFSHLEKLLYHVQAAHYLAGARALAPWVRWRFLWLCYQTRPPYDARWIELSAGDLQYGTDVRLHLLRRVIETRATGSRLGRNIEITESRLPAWEARDDTTNQEGAWL